MPLRALALVAALAPSALAADPVVVRLSERATAPAAVVTVGHVAKVSGGSTRRREQVAALDLADRADGLSVTKRRVEYRLKLAGLTDDEFVLLGADAVAVGVVRNTVSAERVAAAAKVELAKRLGKSTDELFLDLVQPVPEAALPEVADGDEVGFEATPHGGAPRLGRTQMNVTVSVNGQRKAAVPVYLNASPVPMAAAQTRAAPPTVGPPAPADGPVLVKAGQRVTISARAGELIVSAAGEAMQDGKLGQPIKIRNVDSQKVVTGTVSGPGAADVEHGDGR
jgi:flagella basal body P-ring formation protein FlgA